MIACKMIFSINYGIRITEMREGNFTAEGWGNASSRFCYPGYQTQIFEYFAMYYGIRITWLVKMILSTKYTIRITEMRGSNFVREE